jgi:hypothetical protein
VDWRQREAKAAMTLRECREALAARGRTIIDEASGVGAADLADWRHYPDGEVYDPSSHAQFFFHRHAEPDRHGHFHVFLRGEGMPAGVTPQLLPEAAVANAPPNTPPGHQSAPLKRGGRDEVCHLVAIGLDAAGGPCRLFTTNRWVTGETWYGAEDVVQMLDRFHVSPENPSALLGRWVEALVRLFRADIAELLRERDAAILQKRWRWRTQVLDDPRLEIISSRDIDLAARLEAVEYRSTELGNAAGAHRRSRLPRMAEGWGA